MSIERYRIEIKNFHSVKVAENYEFFFTSLVFLHFMLTARKEEKNAKRLIQIQCTLFLDIFFSSLVF
jgi:hypothetical protein